MYTDNDLEQAVEQRIFTGPAVEQFRAYIRQRDNTHVADEENFKLLSSFNDIFVVMACALLLLSAGWVMWAVHPGLAALVVAVLSWLLAEFFVLKRKMALPAIALLAAFVGSVFATVMLSFIDWDKAMLLAAFTATFAAWCHWKRFHVPITVAAGASSAVLFIVTLVLSVFPSAISWMMPLTFIGGVLVFLLAMRWDMNDRERVTGKADVAFWLHLAAAPMIVHPIFTSLGILEGNESLTNLVIILLLYVAVTVMSLVIDRRAFMVSALVYVLVALTRLLESYGLETNNLAYVGAFIGLSLLLLSGFWHKVRTSIVRRFPSRLQDIVPPVIN